MIDHMLCVYLLFYIFPFLTRMHRIKVKNGKIFKKRLSVGCKREIFHIVKKMFIVYYYQNQWQMHFSFTMFFPVSDIFSASVLNSFL